MIPKKFSRLQVSMIIVFLITIFYYFKKDFNAFFDTIQVQAIGHETELSYLIVSLMAGMFIFLFGSLAYFFKIEPWIDKRHDLRLEQKQFEKIREQLEESRPRMLILEQNMESASIMFSNEADKKHRIYLLGVGRP